MTQVQAITVPEAARRLGVGDSAIRQAIKVGRLRAQKDGGTWYVDPDAVAAYRVSNRGPRPKDGRRSARHLSLEGLTPGQVQQLAELADRMRAEAAQPPGD
ncbi:hypothetical protein BE17_10810 [Sorangium cellulosum]|uniref:Helix-turn-helix domain-containing protein n=1 Tax=Sorangium cellulosum TaxID=56 RepID=A0A150R9Y2_SORCE|nr:hypothetical protein BE17_10810 [Sorangium cellulosum]